MGCLSGFILGFINPGDECVVFEPAFPFFMDDIDKKGKHRRQQVIEYRLEAATQAATYKRCLP